MRYVYLLSSKNTGKEYIGPTVNIRKRISTHNLGEIKLQKNGAPGKIIYCEIGLNKKMPEREKNTLSPEREEGI